MVFLSDSLRPAGISSGRAGARTNRRTPDDPSADHLHVFEGQSKIQECDPLKGGHGMAELKVGDTAPDFKLPGVGGKDHTLDEHRGKKSVVLLFYPMDWTPG